MLKFKRGLLVLFGVVFSIGALVAEANTNKSPEALEADLLKVVTLLETSQGSSANKASNTKSTAEMKDLIGLSLKQFMENPSATARGASNKKAKQRKGINPSTYSKVMAISTKSSKRKRRSRYRPCYQFNYQELQNRSKRYQNSITEASRRYGVSENLIKSVITAESCFKVRARSHKGARGLMQLMPATARRFGVKNSYNSHQNIGAGTKYLRWLLDRYSGNVRFALAGYNAGEGKVDRYGGIPPYKETREYVRRVMGVFKTLHSKMPQSANVNYRKPTKSRDYYQKLWHKKQKSKQATKPLYQRRCVEAAPSHLRSITYLKRSGRGGTTWRRYYRMNHAESLQSVTQKTGVHINALKRLNGLGSQNHLQAGHQLVVWECKA